MQKLKVTCACGSGHITIRDGRSFEERLEDQHPVVYGILAISLLVVANGTLLVLFSAVAVA